MERLTQRESILLGYGPQNIIISTPSSSEPKPPLGNSDVDFNDVFGGPPRRYTIQERPHSFTQTTDSDSVLLPRRPWSGLSEKPVFGEESANRRRYAGDDFFDDIFRGDESCNSPRRSGLDPYRSTPGSRILSPARPLPPKAEPFGNSQLAPFSLPAKLTKAMDFPAFGSGNRSPYKHNGASNGINVPHSPLSRFSSQAIQGEDELKNDVQQSFRQHSLSHEFSRDSKEFSCLTKSDETEIRGNIKKDAKAREPPSNSNQFHFSIYKWASKGVPLLMPLRGGNSLRSREKCKTERCSSSNGRIENDINVSQLKTSEMCNVDSLLLNQRTSLNAESSKMESEKQENGSFLDSSTQNKVGYCEIANEALFAIPESKPLDNYQNSVEDISDDLMGRDKREVIEPCSLPEIGFQEKVEKEIPMFTQEAQKSQLRPSRSLSKDKNEIQGTDDIIKKDDEKEIVTIAKVLLSNVDLTENVGKHDGKQKISKGVKTDKASSQGPRVNSGNNLGRNRDRGKVKEFVKIFNEEASSKPKTNVDTQTQSSRWKNKSSYGAYNETTVSTKGTDAKLNIPNVKDVRTFPDASVKVEKDVEQLKKQHSHTKSTIDQRSDNSSGQKGVPVSISESLPFDANDTNLDVPFDFLIKELSIDEGKLIHGGEDNDEIQVIDVKIRKWSKGKEGNIRSLLSTLQYVLWPQSGWKPVPLVDIIEGSAVKRAYQKALLCLHPDKLQQKGAASHQKYTAEKVFDILQEAWDHFNISLGSL